MKGESFAVKCVSDEKGRKSFESVKCKDEGGQNEQTHAHLSLRRVQFDSILHPFALLSVKTMTQRSRGDAADSSCLVLCMRLLFSSV